MWTVNLKTFFLCGSVHHISQRQVSNSKEASFKDEGKGRRWGCLHHASVSWSNMSYYLHQDEYWRLSFNTLGFAQKDTNKVSYHDTNPSPYKKAQSFAFE